jgi:hypothetical protein
MHKADTIAMVMDATSTNIDEVHRRIGRNLLRFQQIEFALKFALPYIHPEGAKAGPEALKNFRASMEFKPLGQVVKALRKSIDLPTGLFDVKLRDVVDERNQLVHHLFELPGIDLMNPAALSDLADYLDRQYESAAELFMFSRLLCGATLLALRESRAGLYPELEAARERLEASLPEIAFVDEDAKGT